MAAANLSTFIRRLTRGMAAETLGDQSDPQLVERFLSERDEAVFEVFVHRHGPMVYRVCWRVLQHDQDVEDAFQATFLVLAQDLCSVRKHASLASWLHGVAHRVALKAQAQAATRRSHEQRAPVPRAVPPDEVTWRELRLILDAELARLPENWRLPLILCYLESRTQDEAAAQLGWSKNTFRRRLEEARGALGRRLARRGVGLAALSAVLLSDCAALAGLPPGLVATAVEAAACVAAGRAAATVVSAEAVALAKGMGTTMSLTRVNIALWLLLTVGSIVTAAGMSASSALPEPPPPREKSRAPLRPEEPRGDGGQDRTANALSGRWQLMLPSGFLYQVLVRPLDGNRLSVEDAVRFSGVYELREGRLELTKKLFQKGVWNPRIQGSRHLFETVSKPRNPAEMVYSWEVRGENELVLVAQPPVANIGSNYLGATLKRLPDEKEPVAEKRNGPAPAAAGGRGDPVRVEGGFLFKDAAEFRAYLRGADIIAAGTLRAWDRAKGTVRVEMLYRGVGKPGGLRFSATGGNVAAKPGDKVLALLKADKDGPKLHSFSAAPGLFRNSDELLSQVEKALKPQAPEEVPSQNEADSARALERIKADYRLKKEPAYQAPVQYCLLLLGRKEPTRLWLASDGVTLFVDRNSNGDLTEPGEAIPFRAEGFAAFFANPYPGGAGVQHTHLHIAVRQRDWQNNKGGYWSVRAHVEGQYPMYAFAHKFAKKPDDAPVIHLGGPLRLGLYELEGGALVRGRAVELNAYVACQYPGVEKAFVDVDRWDRNDIHPVAEIQLPARTPGARPVTLRVPLTRRC